MSERGRRLEQLLPRASLSRRVTVLVLVATLLVLGFVAARSIPIELIPSGFSDPFLAVFVPWQDAPPREVLDKIAMPLEEELSTVRGLDNLYSSSRTGSASVFMTFKLGTDMDVAYREIRDRIERARARMPEDVEQVFIRKHDETAFPVAMVGLAVEEGTTDVFDLIEREVKRPLERLEGVATVEAQGLEEKEILIELDRERVEASGLNIYDIAQDLARDNFTMASGHVRSADRKLLLRSVARYGTPDSVADVQITPSIRLSDVATVRYDLPERDFLVRVNSKPAYAMMVLKEGEANTLEVVERVEGLVAGFRDNPRLKDLDIDLIMSQGEIIRSSLDTLLSSGRIGAFFAMVVLLFFLRRFRLSLIIALSIPLSMVVALVVMYFAGETLNVLSLLGLMISVGLLVDNAVVVAENIHRIHREGRTSRRDSTIQGAGQIAMAITTATLTTMVVFLPVALVEGQGQFFLLRLAIPISVSLLASLLVALVVVPLCVFLTLPSRSDGDRRPAFGQAAHDRLNAVLRVAYERSFGALNRGYSKLLDLALGRRLETIVAIVLVLVGTQFAAKGRVGVVPMSEDDQAWFEISVDLPDNLTFEEAQAWFLDAEKVMEARHEELGLEFYMFVQRDTWGELQGALLPDNERTPREIVDVLLAELPEMPGVDIDTGMASENEDGRDQSIEIVTLYGEDTDQLKTVADELEDVFARLPGVLGVKGDGEDTPNELALTIDRERAQSQGVNPQTLAGVVGYALRGQPLPRVYYGGRDIPVRVRFEEEDREGLVQLGNFAVPTESGETVALSSLVDAQALPAATRISRRNKRTAERIVLELEEGQEETARQRIRALQPQIDLPEGISFAGERRNRNAEEARNLQYAALMSILFVYLLMGFLFESFLLPMAILVTIPLANIGVTWIHLLTGRDIDFLGLVGMIILIGVVVNNGIVLLDYVHRLRDEGMARAAAIRTAADHRFRPIMMTALTTICGMVPLTLGGATRMGLSYKSFGLTLIGGMATSTLLTLLVVPVFYTLFEDARSALGRSISGVLRRARSAEAGGPATALPEERA